MGTSEHCLVGWLRTHRNSLAKIVIDTAVSKHSPGRVLSCLPQKSLADVAPFKTGPHQALKFKQGLSDCVPEPLRGHNIGRESGDLNVRAQTEK